MAKRIIIIVILSFIILIISTLPAVALNRGVGSVDMTVSNYSLPFPNKYYWTGTLAGNYIMSAPTITGGHINSVYLKTEKREFSPDYQFETGWWWFPGEAQPRYFVVVIVNGNFTYFDGKQYKDLGLAQKDHNSSFGIKVDGSTAYFYIDGAWRYSWPAQINQGFSVAGSERQNGNESNYAHLWSLQKRNHAFAWGFWQNQQTWSDRDSIANASYSYSLKKVSNTESYVQIFNYEPFYRLYNGRDHFYTLSDSERWAVLYPDSGNYTYEGAPFFMAQWSESGSVPFYRSYNPSLGDHFYTTSWDEAHVPGYNYEGISSYIYSSQISGTTPLYRSYGISTGDHFYTTSWTEANTPGYIYEKVAGYVRVW